MYSDVDSSAGRFLLYKQYIFGYISSEIHSETNVNTIPDNCLNYLDNSGFFE